MSLAQPVGGIPQGVIRTIGANATILNVGIVGLCLWYVATKQDIPNLLLGALISQGGNALGSLSSVLNSTRASADSQVNVERADQVGPQGVVDGAMPAPADN